MQQKPFHNQLKVDVLSSNILMALVSHACREITLFEDVIHGPTEKANLAILPRLQWSKNAYDSIFRKPKAATNQPITLHRIPISRTRPLIRN